MRKKSVYWKKLKIKKQSLFCIIYLHIIVVWCNNIIKLLYIDDNKSEI